MSKIEAKFSGKLEKSPNAGGWTYVVWPESGDFFGTKGAVKVSGKIDGVAFQSSFMAMGNGVQMLPVKADIRKAIKKEAGETVTVILEKRL